MKYLVHLTAPVTTNLSADNYRGEPRWERNCVSALLSQHRQVHTVWDIWQSKETPPPNLHSGINKDWLAESRMITYGVPATTNIGDVRAKNYIVQYLDGPSHQTKDEFLKFDREKPGSIVATCSFKSWVYIKRLKDVLGEENVEWVQGPTVPFVVDGADNHKQTYLLWSYRNFEKFTREDPVGLDRLFGVIAGYLKEDPSLRLGMVINPDRPETHAAIQADKMGWFFNLHPIRNVRPYMDRVDIFYNIHWHQMMDLMSKTRLIISPAEPFGGPPFEAAMYGIPSVLGHESNPFIDSVRNPQFDELLTAPQGKICDPFLQKIDRLFRDHTFYRKHGDGYRAHVKQYATFEAYVRQIEEIAKKRGWE